MCCSDDFEGFEAFGDVVSNGKVIGDRTQELFVFISKHVVSIGAQRLGFPFVCVGTIGGQGVFVGKSRILEYLSRLSPNGLKRGKLFNYIQLQPIIDVAPDGKTAIGRWRYIAELGEYMKRATWGGGTYENEYIKEGTVWKIKALHAYSRFYTPYADGWGKSASSGVRPEKSFLPDLPPTVSYEPYPAIFAPPFHYKNPVTGK